MHHIDLGLIETNLFVAKECNGIKISKADSLSILNKFKPGGFDTVLPRLIELIKKGEVTILSYRTFDKFCNEISIRDGIPSSIEIILVPGYFKDSLEGIPHCF